MKKQKDQNKTKEKIKLKKSDWRVILLGALFYSVVTGIITTPIFDLKIKESIIIAGAFFQYQL